MNEMAEFVDGDYEDFLEKSENVINIQHKINENSTKYDFNLLYDLQKSLEERNKSESIFLKASNRSHLTKKTIWITRGGKSFQQTVYVNEQEEITKTPIGGDIADISGMDIKKYSEKALLITGDTKINLEALREVKKEIEVGSWNRKLNGWVFPIKYQDTILGSLWSNLIEKGEDEKAQAIQNQKNAAFVEGDKIEGENISGTVTKNSSDSEGIKYDIKLSDGSEVTGINEKVLEKKPLKDDKEISKKLNEAIPENRSKIEKQIFGFKPIEDIHNYSFESYAKMHGITKEDIQAYISKKNETKEKKLADKKSVATTRDKSKPSEGLTKNQIIAKLLNKHKEAVRTAIESGKVLEDDVVLMYEDLKELNYTNKKVLSEEHKRKIAEALRKNGEKEAEEAAKKFVDSLSKEQLGDLKDKFKKTISNHINKEQDKLAKLLVKKSTLEDKVTSVKKEAKLIDNYGDRRDLMNTLDSLLSELEVLNVKVLSQSNISRAVSNGGSIISITDAVGVEHEGVADFRAIDTIDITYDVDTILNMKKPSYIPEIDEEKFERGSFIFDSIKIGQDSYMIAANKYSEKSKEYDGEFVSRTGKYDSNNGAFITLTLDQLVLTQDYYITKKKAEYKKEADERTQRNIDYWDRKEDKSKEYFLMQRNMWFSLPKKISKTISRDEYESLSWQEREKIYKPVKKYGAKKIKSSFDTNHMAGSFHSMYERFVDPTAERGDGGIGKLKRGVSARGSTAHKDAWGSWINFKETLDWKINDINIQRDQLSEIRSKALETSYGESNTSDILLGEFGVKIKRQNGSKIKPKEADQLKDAWINVQKSFGSLRENAEKHGLKLSHAGDKHMFASKAIGVYYPSYKAIGVTAKLGESQLGFTMGHETAHWIDNIIGEKSGKRFASDNYDSTAGKIAITLRKGMNKESSSKYLNSTHECFARAMEMYHAISTNGEKALRNKNTYTSSEAYVSLELYNEKLKPLVEQFLKENKDMLKSMLGGIDILKSEFDNGEIDLQDLFDGLKKGKKKKECVSGIIRNDEGKILFLLRHFNDDFHPSEWCLPGGEIDGLETPRIAMTREVEEEINQEVEYCGESKKVEVKDGSCTIYYHNVFLKENTKPIALLDEEHTQYKFMDEEEWMQADLILDLQEHLVDMFFRNIEKGKKANLGEIRTWKDGKKHQKLDTKWITLKNEGKVNQHPDFDLRAFNSFMDKSVDLYGEFKDFIGGISEKHNAPAVIPPPKKRERVMEKANGKYKGDFTKLKDILRCTIVTDDSETAVKMYKDILDSNDVGRSHYDFDSEDYQGANIAMNFNGITVEIQINTAYNLALKSKSNYANPSIIREQEILKDAGIKVGKGHSYYRITRRGLGGKKELDKIKQMSINYYSEGRDLFTNKE